MPLRFNPSDPSIWKHPCYAYNPNTGPDENLATLGFDRKTLLALSVFREMRNRVVEKKLSLFVVVDGVHRAGKSQFVYTLSTFLSRSFEKNPEKFIVKNAEDLLALIPLINEKKIYNPVIVIDEAGSSLNSADWQERVMRAVIKTLAIIGYLHPTIFFISPLKSQILKGIRDMCHIYLKVTRDRNDYAVVIPYHMKWNSLFNKAYPKKFKINFFGQPVKVASIRVSRPPPELEKAYQQLELNRKPIMLQDIRTDIKRAERPGRRKVVDILGIVKQIQENPAIRKEVEAKRSTPDDLKLNPLLIKQKFGISVVDATTVKSIIEKG